MASAAIGTSVEIAIAGANAYHIATPAIVKLVMAKETAQSAAATLIKPAVTAHAARKDSAAMAECVNQVVQAAHTQQHFAVALQVVETAGMSVPCRRHIIPVSAVGLAMTPIDRQGLLAQVIPKEKLNREEHATEHPIVG
jgi:hypothetical protein